MYTLCVLKAFNVAKDDNGPPGLAVGPSPVQQFTGNPAIGIPAFEPIFCCWMSCILRERLLDAAMNTITAMTMVPQIAALAAMVILSMLDVEEATVRTSRHWEYGTVSGVTLISSSEITQTTIHSYKYIQTIIIITKNSTRNSIRNRNSFV